ATASPGVLLDHSQVGLQHTVPIGTLFRGGPLLNGDGKVLGVASDDYRPFGIDPGDVRQAPDVRAICVVVLACAETIEEIVVEVTATETEAPLTTGEPVRQTPNGEGATDERSGGEAGATESGVVDAGAESGGAGGAESVGAESVGRTDAGGAESDGGGGDAGGE
ncbi:MAG: hypothetical protein OER95_14540, partial [Acidimicrobiia bacterium]|nr:hypothetical protein [Acidimicrobiia bacterium]